MVEMRISTEIKMAIKEGRQRRTRITELMLEAGKELKRQGRLFVHKGEVIVLVPLMRLEEDGSLVIMNRLGRVWQGWRRR